MTRIPEEDRDLFEQAIYLPMVLTVLTKDIATIQTSSFKLKKPYLEWIEETMKDIQKDLARVKRLMKAGEMKVERMQSDESFTMYMFLYKGYEEHHNYFNPRLRNAVENLLRFYLYGRFEQMRNTNNNKEAN
ncbi:hypothetical protein Q75_04290 [Bacillus coahuilensis p1.1.43]|uniref:YhjD n=1 Tax=Bacillus coahuilensis p1.1.43 TaxID=1150625 RepID=A0A147KAJ5_9BACI|nr:hypothetical protein [Bacillus coahuilensis]KUP07727.1 hypothetical protein Q75_04290 [Bacillus coahuilensis p1.1.43]